MTRAQRITNLLAVVVPFLAVLVAIVLLWNRAVGWEDLALLVALYIPIGLGVTVGFHRMLTHRAFQTSKPMEYGLAILGSMAVQGPVIHWVADHRKHHAHTDVEGDPHSPHTGEGKGLRGLMHAHIGWLMTEQGRAARRKYAPDLIEDPGMRFINRKFEYWVAARSGDPVRSRLCDPRRPARRPDRAGVGRPRARLPAAPRDLVDQLDLPLLRQPALRHRRPLDQRVLARAALARRGLAPQPPRLPPLGEPRPRAAGSSTPPPG